MGVFTTGTKLWKPAFNETGWDAAVNTNFDRLSEFGINVKSYGAVGDGVTNDTAAIQAAIDAAVAAGGGTVFIPEGIFVCASGLSWNVDGVYLVGVGANASTLKFTGTGIGITVGDGVAVRNGVGFRDLTIRGNQSVPTTGLLLQTCWQVNLTNVNFVDFATDHLKAMNGGHIRIVGCQASQNVSFAGTFFRLQAVVDSSVVSSTFEGAGGAFTCIAITSAAKEVAVAGCTHRGTGPGTFISVGGTGQEDISIVGCSAQGMTVSGIDASGGVTNLAIMGNVLKGTATATGPGIHVGGSGVVRAVVQGNVLRDWNDAVVHLASAVDVLIVGNYIGGVSRPLFDNGGASGIVAHNVLGAGTPTTTGTGVRYYANKGWQPQGTATITVTASPFTYTAGPTPEVVYIRGGTVSDISKNGRTIFTQTEQTVVLEPAEAVVVTYSVAPTMEADRK
jgi:hypothetical protein